VKIRRTVSQSVEVYNDMDEYDSSRDCFLIFFSVSDLLLSRSSARFSAHLVSTRDRLIGAILWPVIRFPWVDSHANTFCHLRFQFKLQFRAAVYLPLFVKNRR